MSETPDILLPTRTADPKNVDIYTNVLSPQTSSQSRCVFVLKNQGVLAPTSRLVFSILTTDTTANNAFVPLHSGASAAISSATLRCGTRVLARSPMWNHYNAMKSSVHENCDMRQIDMPLTGKVANVGNSPNTDGRYAVDVLSGDYTSAISGSVPAQYQLTNLSSTAPEFSIGLDELFPMMRGQMLALQYFKLPVSVEIEFTQQTKDQIGKVCCFKTEPVDKSITYDLEALKMNLDYIMYDEATMASLRDNIYGSGVLVKYPDLQSTQTSIPAITRPTTNDTSESDITREVMSSGLVVNNVLVAERKKDFGISSITMTDTGKKYITKPTISITNNGSGAVLDPVLTGSPLAAITASQITDGINYTSAPTAVVSAPTGKDSSGNAGTTATFTLTIAAGKINAVTNFVAGSGYLAPPNVVLTGGGGTGGAIEPDTDGGFISSINITKAGINFEPGSLTISAPASASGSTATATFTVAEVKNPLLGEYVSSSPVHNSQINWRANDRIIYPRRVANTAYMRQQVEDVLEYPITSPAILYSLDAENNFYKDKNGGQNRIMDETALFEGHSPQFLAGSRYYQGVQMRVEPQGEGTEIASSQNIIYERHNTHSFNDYTERELRFWTEYERQFMLKDGEVMVSA